jgi:hypothetical protein
MASVFHQIQYWTFPIPVGGAVWLSYGPNDSYKTGTVQMMCSPYTQVGDTTVQQTQTIAVEAFNTQVPTISGDIVTTSCYAGASIANRGQYAIKYFSFALTIIGP